MGNKQGKAEKGERHGREVEQRRGEKLERMKRQRGEVSFEQKRWILASLGQYGRPT